MDMLPFILTFFVFFPSNFVLAWFTAIAPAQPIVAALGENAILPCHISSPDKLTEVRYFKSVHKHLLNLFRDGKVQQECDLQEYVGRTELIKDNLTRGRVALKILNVTVVDEGVYYCFLQTRTYFDTAEFELRVTALGSDPRIEIQSFQDDRVLAVCRSDGWYPKPTVLVKEDDGQTVALHTSDVTLQQQDNLFSVVYHRVITEASSRTFSCLLRTPYHSERMSSLYVADPVFKKTPSLRSHVMVLAVFGSILFLALCAVGALYCSWRYRKNTTGDPERVLLTEKVCEAGKKLKPCSKSLESKLTENDATSEGDPERVLLTEKVCEAGRKLKPCSKSLESELTENNTTSEEALKRIAPKKQEPIKETTGPDETVAKLRKEMEANIAVALKWQKKLKEKDKVIEALKKELELWKMEAGLGKRLTMQSCPRDCVQPPPDDTTELMSTMAPHDPAAST